jgi:hypothetical protein
MGARLTSPETTPVSSDIHRNHLPTAYQGGGEFFMSPAHAQVVRVGLATY